MMPVSAIWFTTIGKPSFWNRPKMDVPKDEIKMNKRILKNDSLQIEYLDTSLRITGFIPAGKPNMLAVLSDQAGVSTPYGRFHFRGGHRLWHSPEAMPRTYMPDDEGATISEVPNGVRIEMPAEPWTHIAKSLEIQLNPDQPQVILRHELRNDGPWSVEFAPWALTMSRLGGVAIFPQAQGNADEAGLLANRHLSIWPYTRISDPRLTLRDDFILVHATPSLPPLKIGYFNPHGWMAYWLDGVLFVKRYDAHSGLRYPDHGCNSETYCNDEFIELESLGPLNWVAPGQTLFHTEIWEIHASLDVPFIPNEIQELISGKS